MAKAVLKLFIVLLLLCDVNGQTKRENIDRTKTLAQTTLLNLKVDFVDATLASFSYELDSKVYALFISNSSKAERRVFISENNVINPDDTLIYPQLKQIGNVGRLVTSSFATEKGRFTLDGLPSQQDYFLHFFKKNTKDKDTLEYVKTFSFNTIAQKPKRQAIQVAFQDITDTSFLVTWINGDGERRIVVVAPGEEIDQPVNGKTYGWSSTYGEERARIGNGFVVYEGNDLRPKVKVTNLKPATKYIIGVYEFNGEGKYRNYLTSTSTNNPRIRTTRLSPPKNIEIETLSTDVCVFRWKKVAGANTYILDLAKDKDFRELVEPYVNLDIGDIGEFELSELKPKTSYFIRLKAKGDLGESEFSIPFEFKTK
ncbi:MAG: fibronectin type III domain-containing protein [Ignavibacteria bacterium]|nr:fibronectin type III domain-containing protein [Ignavibacteria bacterium]